MATEGVLGFHHATAFASDAQRNVAFYVGVLGLRLVKRSVNQDAPEVYHLFYADAVGSPGTDITFFPWRNIASPQEGAGLVREIWLAAPAASLAYWRKRLEAAGVALEASDAHALRFRDPDGLRVAIVAEADNRSVHATSRPSNPASANSQNRAERPLRATYRRALARSGANHGASEPGSRPTCIPTINWLSVPTANPPLCHERLLRPQRL